jgi:hypothetical protein
MYIIVTNVGGTMNDTQNRKVTTKTIFLVIGVAILTAVLSTLIQTWVLGKANPAVTGGVIGAITAVFAINIIKKKSD